MGLVLLLWSIVPPFFKAATEKFFYEFQAPAWIGSSFVRNGQKFWTGRIESKTELIEEGRDLEERYPLIGTTRRPGNYVHTRFRDVASLRKLQPDPLLRIHPRDAEARKIVDKDPATIESPEGAIQATAVVTDETSPGLVIVDFGWGNSWDGGANVNILTSDQPRCPLSGATPNRRFRCEISGSPAA